MGILPNTEFYQGYNKIELFAIRFQNRVHFWITINIRGSNLMFQVKLHITINILTNSQALLVTFITGFIFVRQLKQATLCLDKKLHIITLNILTNS